MSDAAIGSDTLQRVRQALEGLAFEERRERDGLPCVEVEREVLHETLLRLRDRAAFGVSTLVTAVDHLPDEPRFELVHQLISHDHADRVRVKTRLPGDDPRARSASDVWPGIAFGEREVWDMFGIRFDGLENHGRLLMPEGYGHHPLRKDFPQEGIQPDRLYREWDRERRAAERLADVEGR